MKIKKVIMIILVAVIISLAIATPVQAMVTPGPQELTIVVINAPEDLAMQIVYDGELETDGTFQIEESGWRSRRAWETYYRFNLSSEPQGVWSYEDITILISSAEYGEFEITIPVPSWHFRRAFAIRLDLETQTFSPAYSHARNLIIALCWLIPLFAIDSLVFFIFRYRNKESWRVFVRKNLIMHSIFISFWFLLHLVLIPTIIGILFAPLLLVIWVVKLIVEITAYKRDIVEQSNQRAILCAILMNLIGAFILILLGMYIPLPAVGIN